MSAISRRAACCVIRASTSHTFIRPASTLDRVIPPVDGTPPGAPLSEKDKKPEQDNDPLPVPPTVFPAPADPWDVAPVTQRPHIPPKHSPLRIRLAEFGAKMLGYNSRASTSIRETGRMMTGIVEAVDRDHDFWYAECSLPQTYQTFFQLHLVYILTLLPRLRALSNTAPRPAPSIPESPRPGNPSNSTDPGVLVDSSNTVATASTASAVLSKPNHTVYTSELLNHFFDLAEAQMRRILGRGERERVVKKYMEEMGQQWKGSGMAVDYSLGLSMSEDIVEREKADAELAAWLWRNLFDARGLGPPPLPPVDGEGALSGRVKELELPSQLMQVVTFMRREMQRLDAISDDDVLAGNIGVWGPPGLK